LLVSATDCSEALADLGAILAPFRDSDGFGDGDSAPGRYDWYDVGGRFLDWFGGETCWPVRILPRRMPGRLRHLVEPGGQWHDADAESCWPGGQGLAEATGERKERGRWLAEVTEVLSAYPDHQAILVDLHH
jgi:hypothetical protein